MFQHRQPTTTKSSCKQNKNLTERQSHELIKKKSFSRGVCESVNFIFFKNRERAKNITQPLSRIN